MIWLALASALTAWAGVAAYGIWAWRDDRYAERAAISAERLHKLAAERRSNDTLKHASDLMERLMHLHEREPPINAPAPFPTEGDNFTTLPDASVVRPEFGKRPRTDTQPDGIA